MATTNYKLPQFTEGGKPNLIGIYNAAMVTIDAKLKELSDNIANTTNLEADVANLKSSVSSINTSISGINSKITPSTSDKYLTVAELNGAKLTSGGIVYYKKA